MSCNRLAKALLLQRPSYAVSGGCGVVIPTADGTSVALSDGTPLLAIDNEAVYLQPFLGFMYVPTDRFFAQGFVQLTGGKEILLAQRIRVQEPWPGVIDQRVFDNRVAQLLGMGVRRKKVPDTFFLTPFP
ncbi:MAG: hypothetical protein ACC628_08125 [Pirellulaceae bacterium]